MRDTKGFTLIEILVVLGLITVLVSVGLASYTNTNRQTRDSRRKTNLEMLNQALELYRSENLQYPPVAAGNAANLQPYLNIYLGSTAYPSDPQSQYNYYYERDSTNPRKMMLCAYLGNPPQETYSLGKPCGASSCNYCLYSH